MTSCAEAWVFTQRSRAATRRAPGSTRGLSGGPRRPHGSTPAPPGVSIDSRAMTPALRHAPSSDGHASRSDSNRPPLVRHPPRLLRQRRYTIRQPASSCDHPSCRGHHARYMIPTLGPSRLHGATLVMDDHRFRRHSARLTNYVARFPHSALFSSGHHPSSSHHVLFAVADEQFGERHAQTREQHLLSTV
jgi:hypothetical protein